MVDPITVAGACGSVISNIWTLSSQIKAFASTVRDAREDMVKMDSELSTLSFYLTMLQEDDTKFPFPQSLQGKLTSVLENCEHITKDMQHLLGRYSMENRARSLRWALDGQDAMKKLRSELDRCLPLVDIALEVGQIHYLRSINDDTKAIRSQTSLIDSVHKKTEAIFDMLDTKVGKDMLLKRYLSEAIAFSDSGVDPVDDAQISPSIDSIDTAEGEMSDGSIPLLPGILADEKPQNFEVSSKYSFPRHEKEGLVGVISIQPKDGRRPQGDRDDSEKTEGQYWLGDDNKKPEGVALTYTEGKQAAEEKAELDKSNDHVKDTGIQLAAETFLSQHLSTDIEVAGEPSGRGKSNQNAEIPHQHQRKEFENRDIEADCQRRVNSTDAESVVISKKTTTDPVMKSTVESISSFHNPQENSWTPAQISSQSQLKPIHTNEGLEKKSIPEDASVRNRALHLAIKAEQLEKVRLLLRLEVDPNVVGESGDVPCMAAVRSGNQAMLEMILGFRPKKRLNTALRMAAGRGRINMIDPLVRAGADLNSPEMSSSMASLHLATQAGMVQMVTLLLNRGAKVNLGSKKGKPLKIAQDLLKARKDPGKADLSYVSIRKLTERHIEEMEEVIKVLKQAGARSGLFR